jgi:AraC-like DNA-binding protein
MANPETKSCGDQRRVPQHTAHPISRAISGAAKGEPAFPPMRPRVRGGLPPRTLQRVHEHVCVHLAENINIEELAAIAGLSMCHFARAFKQSEGMTPHDYLVQCRVRRAQEFLGTDLSLSTIARVSGFSDQSHFTRRFRERVGVTPGDYRWSLR